MLKIFECVPTVFFVGKMSSNGEKGKKPAPTFASGAPVTGKRGQYGPIVTTDYGMLTFAIF